MNKRQRKKANTKYISKCLKEYYKSVKRDMRLLRTKYPNGIQYTREAGKIYDALNIPNAHRPAEGRTLTGDIL